jgi:hypothetical protein
MSFLHNVIACTTISLSLGPLLPPRSRVWVLTAIMAPIFTVFGTLHWVHWIQTGNLVSSPDTVSFVQMMQAYLFVDLCYSIAVDIRRVPLLSGWIHHIGYYYVAEQLLATHQDGVIRPFMIAELPTAILAWGHIVPALHSERLFGATFLLTRIVLPIAYIPFLRLTNFAWSVVCVALSVHVFWFGRWIARQERNTVAQ